ncbi:hypothetical protein BD779DRAFT_1222355 [Infundibulicybe gibba]|nr:hypothetical protein BD779DRAFT_1222355 [Infundibulicybe gibba]
MGIGLASFSSGLGELTFWQLSTTYAPPSVAGNSVGYFASGTGQLGSWGLYLVGGSGPWCPHWCWALLVSHQLITISPAAEIYT